MSKTIRHNQPKICPLSGRSSFATHTKECPHGENYVKECKEFSSWFWHKVAQFETGPITEEKIPSEIVQKIYGKGRDEAWRSGAYKFALFVESLEEVMEAFYLDKDKYFTAIHERWDKKLEEDDRNKMEVVDQFYKLLNQYDKTKEE